MIEALNVSWIASIRADFVKKDRRSVAHIRSLAGIRHPFIDVHDFCAALAWMIFSEDGHSFRVERLSYEEISRLGISEEELADAVYEADGALNISGHYPINDAIREKLSAGGY